jgi:hypothetical protein
MTCGLAPSGFHYWPVWRYGSTHIAVVPLPPTTRRYTGLMTALWAWRGFSVSAVVNQQVNWKLLHQKPLHIPQKNAGGTNRPSGIQHQIIGKFK